MPDEPKPGQPEQMAIPVALIGPKFGWGNFIIHGVDTGLVHLTLFHPNPNIGQITSLMTKDLARELAGGLFTAAGGVPQEQRN